VNTFTFVIPDYNDIETEKEDIDFEITGIDESFMRYDPDTREIVFFDLSDDHYGLHKVTVTLTDSDGKVTSETFKFSIKSVISNPEEEISIFGGFDLSREETIDILREVLRVKIESLTQLG
jgi:hypothetical protein